MIPQVISKILSVLPILFYPPEKPEVLRSCIVIDLPSKNYGFTRAPFTLKTPDVGNLRVY
jgi:hypothetical protein